MDTPQLSTQNLANSILFLPIDFIFKIVTQAKYLKTPLSSVSVLIVWFYLSVSRHQVQNSKYVDVFKDFQDISRSE